MFGLNDMFNVWYTVSTSIHLPNMFLSAEILFKQRNG